MLLLVVGRMMRLWPDQRTITSLGPGASSTGAAATAALVSAPTIGSVPAVEGAGTTGPAPGTATSEASTAGSPQPAGSDLNENLPKPLGKLVYEDDFGAGGEKGGLEDQPGATDFQRGFHSPGVYHFKILQPNDTRWVVLPRLAHSDLSVQIEMWDNSDNYAGDVAQGLVLGVRDAAHLYAVLVDPRKGRYTVRKLDGANTWIDLIAWKDSPLVKRRDEHNDLRVDAEGGTLTVYLNGALLDTVHDDSYRFGMLGMIVASVDATAPHMHFDNIKIWSRDTPAAAELPATRKDPNGDMVLIPGGEFIMGSNERSDQQPPHIVALSNFYIDRTEVTNGAYKRCVDAGKCQAPNDLSSDIHTSYFNDPQFASFPVIHVSWQQASDFCSWAGKRLPTEAEWEKAASWNAATDEKSDWPWGNVFDPKQPMMNSDELKQQDTIAVGQYAPELNNTVDMAGNVWEWTSSLYKPYPYDKDDGREDAKDPGERVLRGGSWARTKGEARSFFRQHAPPTYADREIGFRCAAMP